LTYWELPSTKKRRAIQKAVDAIESASSSSAAPEGAFPEPERPTWSENRDAIAAEHARLSEQMTILEREHRELAKDPDDVERHREHRERLQIHLSQLRAHMRHLRGELD
jgi:chromosome segregation ATPase